MSLGAGFGGLPLDSVPWGTEVRIWLRRELIFKGFIKDLFYCIRVGICF